MWGGRRYVAFKQLLLYIRLGFLPRSVWNKHTRIPHARFCDACRWLLEGECLKTPHPHPLPPPPLPPSPLPPPHPPSTPPTPPLTPLPFLPFFCETRFPPFLSWGRSGCRGGARKRLQLAYSFWTSPGLEVLGLVEQCIHMRLQGFQELDVVVGLLSAILRLRQRRLRIRAWRHLVSIKLGVPPRPPSEAARKVPRRCSC